MSDYILKNIEANTRQTSNDLRKMRNVLDQLNSSMHTLLKIMEKIEKKLDDNGASEMKCPRCDLEIKLSERDPIRGIGPDGIASEIGILSRTDFKVEKWRLVSNLMDRFGANMDYVLSSIRRAKDIGVIKEVDGMIELEEDV